MTKLKNVPVSLQTLNKNMQRPTSNTHKKPLIIGAFVGFLILLIAVSAWYIFMRQSPQVKTQTNHSVEFVFDENRASGWSASKNIYPKDDVTDDFQGDVDSLPEASMNIYEGTAESPGKCFVMYSYYLKTPGPDQTPAGFEALTLKGSEYSLEKITTDTFVVVTPDGDRTIEANRYYLKGGEKRNLSTGIIYGVVPFNDSYIEAKGYCETPKQLEKIVPVFESVGLKQL